MYTLQSTLNPTNYGVPAVAPAVANGAAASSLGNQVAATRLGAWALKDRAVLGAGGDQATGGCPGCWPQPQAGPSIRPAYPGYAPQAPVAPVAPVAPQAPRLLNYPIAPVLPQAPAYPQVPAYVPQQPAAPGFAPQPQGPALGGDPFDFGGLDQNQDGVLSGLELASTPADFKAAADTDRNGELTRTEHAAGQVNLAFARQDQNGDGVLSGTELNGIDPAIRQNFDTDRNGELTRCEYQAGALVEKAFAADANGDGYLSGKEITPDLAPYAYKSADGRQILTRDNLKAALAKTCTPGPVNPLPQPQPQPYAPQPQPYAPQPTPQPQPVPPTPQPQPRSNRVVHVNNGNFEQEVLKSDVPVIVDFGATWCGPCQGLAPHLDALAASGAPYKIVKADYDESRQLFQKYGANRFPTLMVFKGGQQLQKHEGAMGRQELDSWARRAAGL